MLKKDALAQHQYIIHHLLRRYNVTYEYDEFFQLLLIRMWQLILQYDASLSTSLQSYLYSRLRYYLLDLFRISSRQLLTTDITTCKDIPSIDTITMVENQLLLNHFLTTLSLNERKWVQLASQGYKQYEIAQKMHRSLSSIKSYKKSTKNKFFSYFNDRKE